MNGQSLKCLRAVAMAQKYGLGVTFGLLVAAFALGGIGAVSAQSLEELISESLEHNPEILRAEADWAAVKARTPQVRWWADPKLSIGYQKIPEGSYSPTSARMRMLSLSQTIPFPGKLLLRGQMAHRESMIARKRYEAERQRVTALVKKAYYRLSYVLRSIEIEEEQRELLRKLGKIAEAKYSVGETSQHDVLQAHLELALVTKRLVDLEEKELPIARERLNLLLDRPLNSPVEVPVTLEIGKIGESTTEIEQLAVANRPALGSVKHALERERTAHRLASMEYLPDFTVTLMHEEVETPTGNETTRGVMLTATVPLWFWTKAYGISEKRARVHGAEASYKTMEKRVRFEARSALARCKAAERQVDLSRTTTVPLAEQALSAAIVAYETGTVDFLTLMNGERTLRDARLKGYQALVEYAESKAELERIIGRSLVEE